jgi:hypothetical protein
VPLFLVEQGRCPNLRDSRNVSAANPDGKDGGGLARTLRHAALRRLMLFTHV